MRHAHTPTYPAELVFACAVCDGISSSSSSNEGEWGGASWLVVFITQNMPEAKGAHAYVARPQAASYSVLGGRLSLGD